MALPPPASDQTVLVTGASSGIGTELARELALRGYGVTLVARSEDRLLDLADEVRALGVVAETHTVDLAEPHLRSTLMARLSGGPREVVGVCNNAGFGTAGRFVDQDIQRELVMVRLNVEAVHHLTGAFLPGMVRQGIGAILNVASTAGFQPLPGMATYAATKAFVVSFSEAVHAEVAGSGVSVTALCPGPTRTEFQERSGANGTFRRTPDFVFMDARRVAKLGVDAMVEGRRTAIPGLSNKLSGLGGRLVPRSLLLPLANRLSSSPVRGSPATRSEPTH